MKDCNNCLLHSQAALGNPCVKCFATADGHINLPFWVPDNELLRPEVSTSGNDPVKSPSHYMLFPDMESIEAIEKLLNGEEFVGFLKGNILKYRFRAGRKGNSDAKTLEDVRKSEQYAQMLREHLEGSR